MKFGDFSVCKRLTGTMIRNKQITITTNNVPNMLNRRQTSFMPRNILTCTYFRLLSWYRRLCLCPVPSVPVLNASAAEIRPNLPRIILQKNITSPKISPAANTGTIIFSRLAGAVPIYRLILEVNSPNTAKDKPYPPQQASAARMKYLPK
ncbi:hypothetical protein D3C73_898300 [compost metagenome]